MNAIVLPNSEKVEVVQVKLVIRCKNCGHEYAFYLDEKFQPKANWSYCKLCRGQVKSEAGTNENG